MKIKLKIVSASKRRNFLQKFYFTRRDRWIKNFGKRLATV